MKWYRVKAMVIRHMFTFIHSWEKLVDSFYWPAMDILLWGLTSAWIRSEADILANCVAKSV
jgi:ABC-2 type transport system permease protein